MKTFWQELGRAFSFLTTLPVQAGSYSATQFAQSGRWFPLVGLVIGGLLALSYLVLEMFLPSYVTAVLVLAMWIWLTGGLHIDGLADSCDGLLAPVAADRRLEIMRDPRVGTFGAVGIGLALLLKSAAIAATGAPVAALLLAPVWARWWLLVAARQHSARSEGMGAAFAAGLTDRALYTALFVPVALQLVVGVSWPGVLAIVLAGIACWGVLYMARARLGGVTGDIYGLVVETVEVVILVVFAGQVF